MENNPAVKTCWNIGCGNPRETFYVMANGQKRDVCNKCATSRKVSMKAIRLRGKK
jgi:hypothetical protein